MSEQQTAPGLDEIIVAAPGDSLLCHSLTCRNPGRLAEVMVTFGELGTSWRDALWYDSWHRTYPMRASAGTPPARSPWPDSANLYRLWHR